MTKRTGWDENKIESHLQQLPPIKDRQSKEDLFQSIEQKMKERQGAEREPRIIKKKKVWFFPAIATAAAVLIILLLIPPFLGDNQQFSTGDYKSSEEASDSSEANEMRITMDEAEEESESDMEIAVMPDEEDSDSDGTADSVEIAEVNMVTLPITYQLDIPYTDESRELHTFIVRESIPVTEEIQGDLEELLVYVLTSNQFGIQNIFGGLQTIDFNEEDRVVTLDFSDENRLGSWTTAEMNHATNTIIEVFSLYGFEEVKFTLNGDPGIMYGQYGPSEGFDLLPESRGYYLYKGEDGSLYFIRGVALEEPLRNTTDSLFSLEETLEKMKTVQSGAWYQPTIPGTVEFTEVEIVGDQANITLAGTSSIASDEEFNIMVEAVELAASDFNLSTIVIEGDLVEQFRDYRSEEVSVRRLSID